MKILFAHDHKFLIDRKGNIYSKGGLTSEVWNNYLCIADEIKVIARSKQIYENKANLKLASREEVNFKFINDLHNLRNIILKNKKICSEIDKEILEADLVIVRLPSLIGNLVYDRAKINRKKIIVEVVGCIWDSLLNYGNIKAKLVAPIFYYEMKKRVKEAQNVIYVTKYFLQKRYPNKNNTIFCSNVVLNESSIPYEKNCNRSKIISIGLIGNLDNKIKGIDVAIKSLKLLKDEGFEVELRVLGAGNKKNYENLLKKLGVEKEVYFDGILSTREEVFSWLDKKNFYIQPSFTEGLPRAVIEAMSRKLPIVVSNVGGNKELIDLKYRHKPGLYRELFEMLKKLILNPLEAKQQGENNYKKAQEYRYDVLLKRRKAFIEYIMK